MADLIHFNHLLEIGPGEHPDAHPDRLKSFHFSFGDSGKGPIGYCARIIAKSAEDAVEMLKQIIPDEFPIASDLQGVAPQTDQRLQHIDVYFNFDAISIRDIDEWEYHD